jgi:hypothetical protein
VLNDFPTGGTLYNFEKDCLAQFGAVLVNPRNGLATSFGEIGVSFVWFYDFPEDPERVSTLERLDS